MHNIYGMIEDEIREREAKGLHVDQRLLDTLRRPDKKSPAKVLEIDTATDFLRLLFHINRGSMLLTPSGRSRTLQDCATRMIENSLSFELLAEKHSSYFEACLPVYQNFTCHSFHSIFLLDLTAEERNSNPNATYSIYDGTHKTLVLAYKVLAENFAFEPIRAFLFGDRQRVVL